MWPAYLKKLLTTKATFSILCAQTPLDMLTKADSNSPDNLFNNASSRVILLSRFLFQLVLAAHPEAQRSESMAAPPGARSMPIVNRPFCCVFIRPSCSSRL